jgi:hypothetical protein
LLAGAAVACLISTAAQVDAKTIGEVPAYTFPWDGIAGYPGCGPIAGGMLVGYWDAHGFGNLITGGDGTNSWDTNPVNVKKMIASDGYKTDYWPTPDLTTPTHTDDSLADFDHCSRLPLDVQSLSTFGYQLTGLRDYFTYRGYTGSTGENKEVAPLDPDAFWNDFVAEIDAGRPVELLVDSDGVDGIDHFVAAIGYDVTGGQRKYVCYNGWDTAEHSYYYAPVGNEAWGVYGGTFFVAPEPATMALMGLGGLVVLIRRRRRL